MNPVRPDPVDRDVLVTRLLDARASEADWAALRDLARRDETVWLDLIELRRQALALERGMEPTLAAAELCDMPDLVLSARPGRALGGSRGGLVGWAVAALLALGFVAQQAGVLKTGMESGPRLTSGFDARPPEASLQDYLDRGKQSGRVVGEVPERKVVGVQPAADGDGYDVLYFRQIIERTRVPSLYNIGTSESGGPVLVPASAPVSVGSSF